jgi:MFS family permease
MTNADQTAREHKGLVVGAAGMMVAGILTTFLSPLLAVMFTYELGFNVREAGVLVASGQGGVALAVLLTVPVLPRLNRKMVGIAGAVIAAICLAFIGFADGFGAVLALQIGSGVGAGLSYASANSSLAYSRYPERAFSIVTISGMVVGAIMLTLGPTLYDIWPDDGIYVGIAVAELLCIGLIIRLPEVRHLDENPTAPARSDLATPERKLGPAIALLVAMWMLSIGNAMVWTFAGSISARAGLSDQAAATFLGLSQLLGLIGAGVTLTIGGKVGKMLIIVPAVSSLAIGNLLVGTATTVSPFMIGFVAINLAFYCLGPLLLALAAELDTTSGRLVVVASAITLLAGSAAPALGGWIAGSEEHWSRLGITAMVLMISALPLLVIPVRAAKNRVTGG